MATENEEVVRRAIASTNPTQGTFAAEFWDADADYYPARKFPEAQPCHGLEEIKQFMVRFREMWSSFEWAVQEVIDIGDERALAHMTLHAEGRESRVNLEGDIYQCYWLRHGRFLRVEDHLTLKGALHALGLKVETIEAAGLRAPSNLEVVRSICEAWGEGDFSSAEWAHPEIEFVMTGGPVDGSWTGLTGMAQGWRAWLGAWEDFRANPDEYHELDDERVLVLLHGSARGKTSGMQLGEMRTKTATLFHLHGGKVTRMVVYLDRERALAELGLASKVNSSST